MARRRIQRGAPMQGSEPLYDAAGARRRRQAEPSSARRIREGVFDFPQLGVRLKPSQRRLPTREQLLERMRLQTVPTLETIDDIDEIHETSRPSAPVYKVSSELLGTIGIAGALKASPNIEKTGVNDALGAHFDEYRHIGAEWTAWRSVVGHGVLHACFLSDKLLAEYEETARISSDDGFGWYLQGLRSDIGARCINDRTVTTYMGNYAEGDTYLLWHGSLADGAANPGVHAFDRDGEGVYTIHAAATDLGDELPAGFTRLS